VAPPRQPVITIGASAGGVEAITTLLRGFPPDLPASVMVVLHVPPSTPSALPGILTREGPLSAEHAVDGAPILPGRVYVAPPDHHLVVHPGHVQLTRGPRENRVRPAIDVLFRTAAVAHPGRVIGVVLSGALDDGAAGLVAIKQCGGLAVVQDPLDARVPSMPEAALEAVDADHVVPASEMGALLSYLVDTWSGGLATTPPDVQIEADASTSDDPRATLAAAALGGRAILACPDCGGVLSETSSGGRPHYRCHTGHAYSIGALLEAQGDDVEQALAVAVRVLQERVILLEAMARDRRGRGYPVSGEQYTTRAADLFRHELALRQLLTRVGTAPVATPGESE
jgi:two-component system, chemotaxis family, protein-glutamate methylesterase/glutaminase